MSTAGRVLIVDDEERIREFLSRLLSRAGYEPLVAAEGETALALIRRESPDVVLLDVRMPGLDGLDVLRRAKALDATLPVVMMTAYGLVRGAVEAMQAGASDYLEKPLDDARLVRAVRAATAARGPRQTITVMGHRVQDGDSLRELMGPSEAVARISGEVARVARSSFAVLILGETGAGKELVAQAIHRTSARASAPFVPVDCGAIPEPLFESELFGHERGAFTGAERQTRGKFEIASGGTLFLDEIANMPLGCQAKLLRALQEKSVTRVGSMRPFAVDTRVVAAANQDLRATVSAGTFREDLFFRINEFTIVIPPLRDRTPDIPFLAKRFLDLTNHELSKSIRGFSDAAMNRLLAYAWPGNVRELRSSIRRAVLLAGEVIEEEHLGLPKTLDSLGSLPTLEGAPTGWTSSLKEQVRDATMAVERRALLATLRKTGGNKAKAARILQIDYKTILAKLKAYGISAHDGEDAGTPKGKAHR